MTVELREHSYRREKKSVKGSPLPVKESRREFIFAGFCTVPFPVVATNFNIRVEENKPIRLQAIRKSCDSY